MGFPQVSLQNQVVVDILWIGAGVAVLGLCIILARVLAHEISHRLARRSLPGSFVILVRRFVYVAVIGFGVVAAFALAFETANVALVGILLATVIAALGVQQLLQDYVSGYYLLIERHMRIGDRIKLADLVGTVLEVRLRVTLLRTDDGNLAVIPNSALFSNPVIVYKSQPEEATSAPPG